MEMSECGTSCLEGRNVIGEWQFTVILKQTLTSFPRISTKMKGEVYTTVTTVTRFSLQARRAHAKLCLRVTHGIFRRNPPLPCKAVHFTRKYFPLDWNFSCVKFILPSSVHLITSILLNVIVTLQKDVTRSYKSHKTISFAPLISPTSN